MAIYAPFRTGLEGPLTEGKGESKRARTRFRPDNIHDALRILKASKWAQELLSADVHEKYSDVKLVAAELSPKVLGMRIKRSEIIFHREVPNPYLWSKF